MLNLVAHNRLLKTATMAENFKFKDLLPTKTAKVISQLRQGIQPADSDLHGTNIDLDTLSLKCLSPAYQFVVSSPVLAVGSKRPLEEVELDALNVDNGEQQGDSSPLRSSDLKSRLLTVIGRTRSKVLDKH